VARDSIERGADLNQQLLSIAKRCGERDNTLN
jgi:hypothetical protein